VRAARHRQHSRSDGGDTDCQRCAPAHAHKSNHQRNLASSRTHDRTARFIPARRRQPPEPQVGLSVDVAVSPLN
jgi:hypothetical protein